MALTEREVEDQVEIVGEFRQIQVRVATIIERDGVEISRAFRRKVLTPDADVSGEGDLVRAVAPVIWTQTVRDAWANRPRNLPTPAAGPGAA